MQQFTRNCSFMALAILGSSIAAAETMPLTFIGVGPKKTIDYTVSGNNGWGTVKAGVYNWNGGVDTFCVQLQENISTGDSVDYKVVDPSKVPDSPPGRMGDERATLVRDLYARWYDNVMSRSGSSAKKYAAAFAMNIWEITHQNANENSAMTVYNKLDFDIGNARFDGRTNGVNNLANDMLESLGGGEGNWLSFDGLNGLKDTDYQDQLIVLESEVPVPGAAGIASIIGLCGIRRRRRR